MTDNVEIKGFGAEVKTEGKAVYPVLLLLSFLLTTGALMYMIERAGNKI